MTERQLLRITQGIALLARRAKGSECRRLTKALDEAGYYAGWLLGEKLAEDRKRAADGESVTPDTHEQSVTK